VVADSSSMNPQIAIHRNKVHMAQPVDRPDPRANSARNWHALEESSVIRLLGVDRNAGLTSSEVVTRRLQYGPNSCEGVGSRRVTVTLVLLSFSTLIGFLLTAAILNSAVRDSIEVFSILVVVVMSAIVGFVYVLKAARALDAMRYATRTSVRVVRDGHEANVKAEELVPGDIVRLSAGDCVPADARLIETRELQVQESVLTRKSTAVDKAVSRAATDAALPQRQSMVYLGSMILNGNGLAAVVATGVQSELGKRASCSH
jgi:P-type Ca2+ transporter type 2C